MQDLRLDSVASITMGQAPVGKSYNQTGDGLPLIAGAGDFGELYPAPKKYTGPRAFVHPAAHANRADVEAKAHPGRWSEPLKRLPVDLDTAVNLK